MPTFRRVPLTVQAVQFTGTPENAAHITAWAATHGTRIEFHPAPDPHLTIATLEGTMTATVGDWVVQGVANEFHPVKPAIFALTHEPA